MSQQNKANKGAKSRSQPRRVNKKLSREEASVSRAAMKATFAAVEKGKGMPDQEAMHHRRVSKNMQLIRGKITGQPEDLRIAQNAIIGIIDPIGNQVPTSEFPVPAFEGQRVCTLRTEGVESAIPTVPRFEGLIASATKTCQMIVGLNRTSRRYALANPDPVQTPALTGTVILDVAGGAIAQPGPTALLPFALTATGLARITRFGGFLEPIDAGQGLLMMPMPHTDGPFYAASVTDMTANTELRLFARLPEAGYLWAVRFGRYLVDESVIVSPWAAFEPSIGGALCKTGVLSTSDHSSDLGFFIEFISTTSLSSQAIIQLYAQKTDPLNVQEPALMFTTRACAGNLLVRGTPQEKQKDNFTREVIVNAGELLTNTTPVIQRGGTAFALRLPTRTQFNDIMRFGANNWAAMMSTLSNDMPKFAGDASHGLHCFHIGNGNERDVIVGSTDKVDARLMYIESPEYQSLDAPQSFVLRYRQTIAYTSVSTIIEVHPAPEFRLSGDVYRALSCVNPCSSNDGHMDNIKGILSSLGKLLTSDEAYNVYDKGYDKFSKLLKTWLAGKFSQGKGVVAPEFGDRIHAHQRAHEIVYV
jgi:hypothetical protein